MNVKNKFGTALNDFERILLLSSVGVLFVVWPIPHTTLIRELSLFIALFVTGLLFRQNDISLKDSYNLLIPAILYILFLIWTVCASVTSAEPLWSLREFKTQWVMGTLTLILGVSVAILANKTILRYKDLNLLFFMALTFHIICVDIDGIYTILKNAGSGETFSDLTFLTRAVGGFAKGPIDASLLSSILIGTILAEYFLRTVHKKRRLSISSGFPAFSFLAALLSSLFCGFRNIFEVSVLLIFSGALIFFSLRTILWKKIFFAAGLMFLSVFILFAAYKTDRRWGMLIKTIDLVWNTTDEKIFLRALENPDANRPTLSNNEPVNISNYQRFVRYKIGLDFIRKHPYGIGYGRNVFGHILKQKYGDMVTIGLNSESSAMDIMIGTGFIGFFLWLSFLLSLLWMGFKYLSEQENFYSLWLLMTIFAFGTRMIVDSVLRDHLLQQFMFLLGFLFIAMLNEKRRSCQVAVDSAANDNIEGTQ